MKRENKYIIKGVFALMAASLAFGCTGDFEEFNTNPFAPTPDQMMGDNAGTAADLATMINALGYQQQNDSQLVDQFIGFEYGGTTTTADNFSYERGRYAWYNPPVSSGNHCGITFEKILPDTYTGFNKIRENTGGKGAVYAMASIVRIAATIKLSDTYGPVPYSKITGAEFTVPYDSEQDLYNYMFEDLTEAINTLQSVYSSSGEIASTLVEADMFFSGNVLKWLKYANTLQMRMAIRISNADEALAREKFNEALERGYVMETADDSVWRRMEAGQANPYSYSAYTWLNGDLRPSASVMSYLNGYGDPRREKYITPQTSSTFQWRGVLSGTNLSSSIYQGYYKNQYANLNDETIASVNSPILVMSASEAWFLRAEAALNGWTSESAKECYEQGVTVSMNERGAAIGNYLSSEAQPENFTDVQSSHNRPAATTVCPKWNDGASKEENRERVLIQKWLANFPNGWETWADIRRTGYPKLFKVGVNECPSGEGVTDERGMRRMKYPQSEYNTNPQNVLDAVKLLGGDDLFGTDLWWAKKN